MPSTVRKERNVFLKLGICFTKSKQFSFEISTSSSIGLNRWGFMVIFWNFSGVPFVSFSDNRSVFYSLMNVTSLTSILSYTWPRMILLHTVFPLLATSLSMQFFARLITCTFRFFHKWLLFLTSDLDSWDTAMAQKSRFKMQTQGITEFRKTFPQLPGCVVENPTFIQTAHG